MKSNVCIVHHLGLGDQIMINGMVRHFLEKYSNVYIVVKDCHMESVKFMYRDTENVKYIVVSNTNPQFIWSQVKKISDCDVIPLATYGVNDDTWKFFTQTVQGNSFTNWAHGVYIQAGLNPLYMYSKFKVNRDHERENELFNKSDLDLNEKYIFIHDDHFRERFNTKHRKDLKIFKPGSFPIDTRKEFFSCDNPNIFDYLKIIENAEEVHCMNSSYNWMIDLMKIGDSKKNFFHTYIAHPYYVPNTVKTVFNDKIWTFVD